MLNSKTIYRRILKLHKSKLPPQFKELGDNFVRNEFKLHLKVNDEKVLNEFKHQWILYINQIESQDDGKIGKNIDKKEITKFSDSQREKLQQFKIESMYQNK
eukprot:TRINITY_DN9528_c0_g1_i1.p1 TRINITY_DN9528_c0_g1~~TRINITY_DN9528_c0_g1_i1.p1  ORF type:complete len:102 (-),score=24.68 TRINITY_DN9528_c0_g1_i1:115-420(-)